MRYTVGVDIGGTFTDCVVIADGPNGTAREHITMGKALSTPPHFDEGFIDSMVEAARQLGIGVDDLVANSVGIYHGCTVATNALVEGRTARVALLTTSGHKDTIFAMQAGGRLKHLPPEYVAHVAMQTKPLPLVPKALCGEIDERVTFDGKILVEMNEETARAEIARLIDAGAEAFAIALLWSVVNDSHERRLESIIHEMAPESFVSRSSEVISRTGEYERTIATVLNALIGPEMDHYLGRLEEKLLQLKYERRVQIMTCTGGVIDSARARVIPVLTIGSGPVAGLIGAATLAESDSTMANVITTDMGGTTFDVGVVSSGVPLRRSTSNYGQYEYFVPTLDVRSVGAGGGSIIRFDAEWKTLKVGPQSAGARPGPACYRQGGTEATVTDADLVLGLLNPEYFLGGEIKLDVDSARSALARVGDPLGFNPDTTAAAAARIVDNAMADAIRLASVRQGHDPRRFELFAFGGAGPVHATALARELGMNRVVVPLSNFASGWSAFGISSSDVVVVREASVGLKEPFDPDELNRRWNELEREVLTDLEKQGIDAECSHLERFVDMRYAMQVNQVEVRAPEGRYDETSVRRLVNDFEIAYEGLYGAGSGYAGAGFAITALRLRGTASITDSSSEVPDVGLSGRKPPQKGVRSVIWYDGGPGSVATPVIDGTGFEPGMSIAGPAVVEYPDTTVVLRHGDHAAVDHFGSVVVEVR